MNRRPAEPTTRRALLHRGVQILAWGLVTSAATVLVRRARGAADGDCRRSCDGCPKRGGCARSPQRGGGP